MWAHAYEMMGDALRTRMSPRYDVDGLTPNGSGFLRLVLSKTGMTDATAYDLQTKKNYQAHIATNMPADLTCEGMETWIDTMRRLNNLKLRQDGDWELIQNALGAFPPDIGALMTTATERHEDTIDLDSMIPIWAATLERNTLRLQRHADGGGRAMAVRAADADCDDLRAQVQALTAALAASVQLQSGGANPNPNQALAAALAAQLQSGALAAAAYPRRPDHPQCPPMPVGCGQRHAGGLAECWFLHPDQVPSRMGFMLRPVHAKRAAHNLPDLSAKFPPTEVGRRPPAARGAAVRVVDSPLYPALACGACVQGEGDAAVADAWCGPGHGPHHVAEKLPALPAFLLEIIGTNKFVEPATSPSSAEGLPDAPPPVSPGHLAAEFNTSLSDPEGLTEPQTRRLAAGRGPGHATMPGFEIASQPKGDLAYHIACSQTSAEAMSPSAPPTVLYLTIDASSSPSSTDLDKSGELNLNICASESLNICRVERASGAITDFAAGPMDVDSMASVTLTPHEEMFKPGSLVPTSCSFVEVANGQREVATHIGTLLLEVTDSSGVVRTLELPNVWLVPALAMSLLSVRALKKLGWRAPDFEALVLYDGDGHSYPIMDADPSYTLASRVVAAPGPAVGAAVLAPGRAAIPTSKSSPAASAEIYRASFGHLAEATIRSILHQPFGVTQ